MIKPVIAVTLRSKEICGRKKPKAYLDWVKQWGGEHRVMAPGEKHPLKEVSGLILSGGEDIDPQRYGEKNWGCEKINPARDAFELKLVRTALRLNLPVLAVCRGIQVLAVALGGSLIQHLPRDLHDSKHHISRIVHRGPRRLESRHQIQISLGTKLFHIIQRSRILVNSFHHQAIGGLPRGVRVSACSRDGVIEAIEVPGKRFVIGVQWHPERWEHHSSKALMQGFLEHCRKTYKT